MNECEEMNNIERWTAVVFGRGCERCVKGSAESSKLTGESPELVRAANQVVERGGQRWRGAKVPQKTRLCQLIAGAAGAGSRRELCCFLRKMKK